MSIIGVREGSVKGGNDIHTVFMYDVLKTY